MMSGALPPHIGVLGGTFDPLHVGHIAAAEAAMSEFRLDRVLFVPTGAPWQKERYSPSEDRFMMTVLGTAANERFAVSRMEIDRDGPTYTADTMEHLRDFYGEEARLLFIAGADAVLGLGTWVGLDRLASLAEVVAVHRPGFDLARLQPQPDWPQIHPLAMPGVAVSSTELRARAARGEPIEEWVPEPVVRYAVTKGLYAVRTESLGG
ncbi:MAG TPA: nicotinate-nucleotide adenylyltransferase [Actinomycetota bacterium]|jgi:nicotinate-nucleotide adenylyltransferase|nr:nicotinate-nucleotide adenylyltransferase [Actinomycetota bacterium]